ncbi:MAG: hypothetical protein GYA24_07260 [Candidatus Lokiarchaeota archaeon]|nr:hypothetical protein [Candidatus Lokiarchaeota archaeon]
MLHDQPHARSLHDILGGSIVEPASTNGGQSSDGVADLWGDPGNEIWLVAILEAMSSATPKPKNNGA